MRPLGHEDGSFERHDGLSALVEAATLDEDQPAVRFRRGFPEVGDPALGIDGVAVKNRPDVLDFAVVQVGDRPAAHVRDAHADHDAEYQRPDDQALTVLRASGVVGIDMDGVLVHGQQREPSVIGFTDRPPRPVLEDLPDFELVKVPSVWH